MASASCSTCFPEDSDSIEAHPDKHTEKDRTEQKIATNLDGGEESMDMEMWSFLPEEVLDKVVARLPIQALFRARVLSKQWKDKISSLPFETEVSMVSSNWASFCPLYVSMDSLLGFDRLSMCWRELFSLSYFLRMIDEDDDYPRNLARCMTAMAGSLIGFKTYGEGTLIIHVTNPINRSCRQLAPLPVVPRRNMDLEHSVQLVPLGSSSYKVIVITTEVNYILSGLIPNRLRIPLSLQIYDSISKSWTEENPAPLLSSDWRYDSSAYFEGTVYSLLVNNQHGLLDESALLNDSIILLAYDTEKEVFRQVEFSLSQITNSYFWWSKLVVCGSDLMLLVAQMDPEIDLNPPNFDNSVAGTRDWNKYYEAERLCIREQSILVYKMDRSSLQLTEVSRGPSQKLLSMSLTDQVASDEKCLYFQALDELDSGIDSVIIFDVPNQKWSHLSQLSNQKISRVQKKFFSLTNYAFQPGLNPFIVA